MNVLKYAIISIIPLILAFIHFSSIANAEELISTEIIIPEIQEIQLNLRLNLDSSISFSEEKGVIYTSSLLTNCPKGDVKCIFLIPIYLPNNTISPNIRVFDLIHKIEFNKVYSLEKEMPYCNGQFRVNEDKKIIEICMDPVNQAILRVDVTIFPIMPFGCDISYWFYNYVNLTFDNQTSGYPITIKMYGGDNVNISYPNENICIIEEGDLKYYHAYNGYICQGQLFKPLKKIDVVLEGYNALAQKSEQESREKKWQKDWQTNQLQISFFLLITTGIANVALAIIAGFDYLQKRKGKEINKAKNILKPPKNRRLLVNILTIIVFLLLSFIYR